MWLSWLAGLSGPANHFRLDPVVQLAEQRIVNPCVAGSSPAGIAILDYMKVYGGVTQLGECLPCTQNVVGSIPSTSTILR